MSHSSSHEQGLEVTAPFGDDEEGFLPTAVEYHRRWGPTIVFGLLGLVFAFGTYKMVLIALTASAVAWVVVLLLGAVAIGLLGASVTLNSEANCPACGYHQDIGTGEEERQLCHECQRFLLHRDGKVETLPIDTVLEEPEFQLSIPNEVQLPPVCTVCGEDATHAEPLSYKNNMLAAKAAVLVGGWLPRFHPTLALGGSVEANLPIPYCDAHDEGAVLQEKESEVLLGVHSYRFVRAYCQLNGKHLKS
ncbi:MAG: hypothetical protein EP343_28670 [Deltaproteobacteria bacterium]|nr:MAG: hypothetical protein EP343_28670 [Deltaproteobacteria bacterium]